MLDGLGPIAGARARATHRADPPHADGMMRVVRHYCYYYDDYDLAAVEGFGSFRTVLLVAARSLLPWAVDIDDYHE